MAGLKRYATNWGGVIVNITLILAVIGLIGFALHVTGSLWSFLGLFALLKVDRKCLNPPVLRCQECGDDLGEDDEDAPG